MAWMGWTHLPFSLPALQRLSASHVWKPRLPPRDLPRAVRACLHDGTSVRAAWLYMQDMLMTHLAKLAN